MRNNIVVLTRCRKGLSEENPLPWTYKHRRILPEVSGFCGSYEGAIINIIMIRWMRLTALEEAGRFWSSGLSCDPDIGRMDKRPEKVYECLSSWDMRTQQAKIEAVREFLAGSFSKATVHRYELGSWK